MNGWLIFGIIHIIGAVIMLIVTVKLGIMHDAKLHGDGFRFATPSDILFQCIFLWEIILFVNIMISISMLIDSLDW